MNVISNTAGTVRQVFDNRDFIDNISANEDYRYYLGQIIGSVNPEFHTANNTQREKMIDDAFNEIKMKKTESDIAEQGFGGGIRAHAISRMLPEVARLGKFGIAPVALDVASNYKDYTSDIKNREKYLSYKNPETAKINAVLEFAKEKMLRTKLNQEDVFNVDKAKKIIGDGYMTENQYSKDFEAVVNKFIDEYKSANDKGNYEIPEKQEIYDRFIRYLEDEQKAGKVLPKDLNDTGNKLDRQKIETEYWKKMTGLL